MLRLLLPVLVLTLAACGAPKFGRSAASPVEMLPADPSPRPPPRPGGAPVAAAALTGGAQTAAALDTTTAAEKAAAVAAPAAAGTALGQVSVALGNPAEPGFWLRSALVTAPGRGRAELPGGASVAVDLRPGEGAALMSFAAYRALGLALTDLPSVTVYAE